MTSDLIWIGSDLRPGKNQTCLWFGLMTEGNLGSRATRGRLLHAPFLGRSHWPLGRPLGCPGPAPGASKGWESWCCQLGPTAEAARPGGFEPLAQLSTARDFTDACPCVEATASDPVPRRARPGNTTPMSLTWLSKSLHVSGQYIGPKLHHNCQCIG